MSFAKFSVFILLFFASSSPNSWELRKNESGIKIHTRPVEGFDLKQFRGVITLNESIQKVERIICDIAKMPQWIPNCIEARQIKNDKGLFLYYTITETPFPLDNRDVVNQFNFIRKDNSVKIEITAKPDYLAVNEDMVRIPYIKGFWLLEQVDHSKTKLTYQMLADPGGSIPTWLANSAVVDNPFNTLLNIESFLKNQ
jgi:hypothetical protein